jgi:hypothetical protein
MKIIRNTTLANHRIYIALRSAVICCSILVGTACSSSSNNSETSDTTTDETADNAASEFVGNFNSALFGDALQSVEQVSCTLDSGTSTTCIQLTFTSNAVGDTEGTGTVGPYCPDSITIARNEAGFGVYDGPTTPGFQPLVDAAIAMDADGYDIVNDDGTINVSNLTMEEPDLSYCLQASFDSNLELTFLIPIEPEFRSQPWNVETVASVGVGISGVPVKGYTPSVTVAEAGVGGTGSGNIPSIDHCGGHPDPAGYYHWHLLPQGTNTVLASDTYNYTEQYGITCSNSNVAFNEPASFAGLAKDGFPMYGPFDSVDGVNTQPSEVATLDECNGHTHVIDEFPNGVYHYHALQDAAPNIPPCLKGSFVERDFLVDGRAR